MPLFGKKGKGLKNEKKTLDKKEPDKKEIDKKDKKEKIKLEKKNLEKKGVEKKGLFVKKKKTAEPAKNINKKKKKAGTYIAIDIGNRSIKSVVGEYSNGKLKIYSMQSIEQEENVYDCGLINNEKAIVSSISKMLETYNIKERDAILAIESFEVIKREMTIPVLDKQDAISAITFEIGEYLPIDIEKYIIQYKEIDRFIEKDVEKANILVYAFPQKIAEQLFGLMKDSGLNPLVLDIQSNIIEKLFNTYKINDIQTNKNTVAIVDIGNTGINLSIIKDGKHEFNRIIKMNSSIKNALILSNACTKENVDSIIEKYSHENIFSDAINPNHSKIQDEIIYLADLWITDILKLFQYYTSRNNNNKIDTIFIYGGGAAIKNIEFYIGSRIGIPTIAINSIENLQLPNIAQNQELIKYVNCIGALIGR